MSARASVDLKPSLRDPRWLPLAVTTVGSFMSILDSTIVNIALPSILRDFHADVGNGQLVLTSYILALAVVIPLTGFLGERVGMKRLYMITLTLFTAGSILCGFAWNLQSLILFRIIQGLGGGMLQPLGMAIVFTMITPLERGYFVGMLGLPVLLAPLVGPSLGGYLVQYASWRMIFLVNLPIGAANVVMAYFLLKETARKSGIRLDVRGFAYAFVAFPTLLLGLSRGAEEGWGSPLVIVLLLIGAVAFLMFVRTELSQPDPMLQLRLFSSPMFRLAIGIQGVTQFSLFGLQYLLPLFLQTARGWGASQTGLVLLPQGFVSFVTMNLAGRNYNRIGPRPLAVTGLTILVITTAICTQLDATSGVPLVLGLVSLRGMALGLVSQTIQVVAYNTMPEGQVPRATGLMNMFIRVNSSFVTAVLTSVLVMSLFFHGAPEGSSIAAGTAPLSFMLRAFHEAFFLQTLITASGVVMAFFVKDRVLEEWRVSRRQGAPVAPELALAVVQDDRGEPSMPVSSGFAIRRGARGWPRTPLGRAADIPQRGTEVSRRAGDT